MNASLEKTNRRLGWLDFGKAAGILMVLMVHAGSSLPLVTSYGGLFYMPIFFVAAGYTYRCSPKESFGLFLKKKAKRLLVPYFGTSAFLWLFFWVKDSLLLGNPGDLKLDSVFGIFYSRNQMYRTWAWEPPAKVLMDLLNSPLWFLTAMFLVYVWYEWISRSKRKGLFLVLGLVLSVVWHYSTRLLLPWSLDAVPYFACFFAVGEWLKKHGGEENLRDEHFVSILAILFLYCSVSGVNLSVGQYGISMLGYLAVGSAGSVLVFAAGAWLERKWPRFVQVMSWMGQETLLILCLHMFLFMFIRVAAGILGLGAGLTQAALVVGSAVALTAAGRILRYVRQRF